VTALAREPVEEGQHAPRRDVPLGEEDDGDDQHHQQMHQQPAERTGLRGEPADSRAHVGLDPCGEGSGFRLRQLVPGTGDARAERDRIKPGRGRGNLERRQ
jgi:hypothetical protein